MWTALNTAVFAPIPGARHGRKCRILAQHAQAVANILDDGFEKIDTTHLPALLLSPLDPPKLNPRPPHRFLPSHSAPHHILGDCRDVELQLCVHLAFHSRTKHYCPQPLPYPLPPCHT